MHDISNSILQTASNPSEFSIYYIFNCTVIIIKHCIKTMTQPLHHS